MASQEGCSNCEQNELEEALDSVSGVDVVHGNVLPQLKPVAQQDDTTCVEAFTCQHFRWCFESLYF